MGVLAAGVALLFMQLHHGVHHAFHAIRLNVRGRPSALIDVRVAVPRMWRLERCADPVPVLGRAHAAHALPSNAGRGPTQCTLPAAAGPACMQGCEYAQCSPARQ